MRFSLPHRRRRVFSFFYFRSSFSRFSDFIEASRVKKKVEKGKRKQGGKRGEKKGKKRGKKGEKRREKRGESGEKGGKNASKQLFLIFLAARRPQK